MERTYRQEEASERVVGSLEIREIPAATVASPLTVQASRCVPSILDISLKLSAVLVGQGSGAQLLPKLQARSRIYELIKTKPA